MARALVTSFVLAGCYSPDARDCTVTCTAAAQCVAGQTCGADGFCAAPSVAGHCSRLDAAAQQIALAITIQGSGRVTVDSVGTCDADTAPHQTCTFVVPANALRVLDAIASDQDQAFVTWTQACAGSQPTCALVPVMSPTHVGAKFQ